MMHRKTIGKKTNPMLLVRVACRGRSSFYEPPPSRRRAASAPQAAYYAPAAAAALTFELAMPT